MGSGSSDKNDIDNYAHIEYNKNALCKFPCKEYLAKYFKVSTNYFDGMFKRYANLQPLYDQLEDNGIQITQNITNQDQISIGQINN